MATTQGEEGPTTERLMLPMLYLDTLWVQVTGTVCNIACKHCFISCGPKVERHRMMSAPDVIQALDDGVSAGLRSIWFTGGEPFLHPEILALIDAALQRAPLGILSNGVLIDEPMAQALGERFASAPYNLELRISLDGCTPEDNDRVRGRGVFAAAVAGIERLASHGLEPVVAVSLLDDADAASADQASFVQLLREHGVSRPRVKWIPPFRIGRERSRRGGRAYRSWERLTAGDLLEPEAPLRLQCGTSRCVTSEGVFACPILINEPGFRLGSQLSEAIRDHPVDHEACHTCWVEAFSCSV
ncbi:MAG TPA: radical SAM protein [Deltaproteobacteria bacterium]|nr:radical SAM protein [Deltaproteobacteria bacterium]